MEFKVYFQNDYRVLLFEVIGEAGDVARVHKFNAEEAKEFALELLAAANEVAQAADRLVN